MEEEVTPPPPVLVLGVTFKCVPVAAQQRVMFSRGPLPQV